MKKLSTKSEINAIVRIPGSKSVTHRAVIAAGLADGESLIRDFLECEDTLYTIQTLNKLGVQTAREGKNLRVRGLGGHFQRAPGEKALFLGNSGTSFRLLTSVVALCEGDYLLTGSPRMAERPIGPLVQALTRLGVNATYAGSPEYPPVKIKAKGIRGGRVSIAGHQSSQFVSSLLLSGPYAIQDVEIDIIGELVSKPYVDITTDVMSEFGVQVYRDEYRSFKIKSGQSYRAGQFDVQGDASSASYFWAAAAVTGGMVTIENISPADTRQGDIRFLQILEKMGCRVEKQLNSVTVKGRALKGVDVDMGQMPDLVPTLAAMALFAEGDTVIRNVSHLRFKESDRLHAVWSEWRRLGGRVDEREDGLVIQGGHPLKGSQVDPHDDHRLAMSLAVVALKVRGVELQNEDCVQKSFPQFWEYWDSL